MSTSFTPAPAIAISSAVGMRSMNHAVCAAGMSHKESGTDQTQVTARVSTGECESLRVAACVLLCVTYVTCTRTLGSQALHSSRQKIVNGPLNFQLEPQLLVAGDMHL